MNQSILWDKYRVTSLVMLSVWWCINEQWNVKLVSVSGIMIYLVALGRAGAQSSSDRTFEIAKLSSDEVLPVATLGNWVMQLIPLRWLRVSV